MRPQPVAVDALPDRTYQAVMEITDPIKPAVAVPLSVSRNTGVHTPKLCEDNLFVGKQEELLTGSGVGACLSLTIRSFPDSGRRGSAGSLNDPEHLCRFRQIYVFLISAMALMLTGCPDN